MKRKKLLWLLPVVAVAIVLIYLFISRTNGNQKMFLSKENLLKAEALTVETLSVLGDEPVDSLGHVVFFSISDGASRARVFKGKGKSLDVAWNDAVKNTLKGIEDASLTPHWVRVDIVNDSWVVTALDMLNELADTPSGFDFHGLSFDPHFETALLEGQLNGMGIYDYKEDRVSMERLNTYLKETDQNTLQILPDDMIGFDCLSWFCGEDDSIHKLIQIVPDTGRREVSELDADYAKKIIDTASTFLANQVQDDGSFIYGIRPQFDKEIDNYNILRHSGSIWSLICRYRMFPEGELKEKIESAIGFMLNQLRYDEDGAAYLQEIDDIEMKLGGNGIAVVTLTEYMDVFQNEDYRDVCEALGEGILKQQDPENGSYWHILYSNFTRGEPFRTVYYDGECTFALARLYSLTKDQKWLDAACKAIDHFIDKDYTRYRDHWVAYSLNEVTKYVDKKEYFDFALANAVNNYERIMGRFRTYPTNLELLISSFETWQRMVDNGYDTGDFEVQELLDVIVARAKRQLSGFFYPELAMYMQNPQRILGSFMMRDDKFRVRIDDVQHNIGGFYLYWKNYDAMMAAGLDSGVMDTATKDADTVMENDGSAEE